MSNTERPMARLDEFEREYLKLSGSAATKETFEEAVRAALDHFEDQFVAHRADRLAAERSDRAAFEKEVRDRWREGLDELEGLVLLCSDVGEALIRTTLAPGTKSWKHQAVFSTHARCLRVAREIVCLLSGGFADGALGRWRTLHELAVVANLLVSNDEDLSRRYILHRVGHNYKAAGIYQKHHKETNSAPIDEETLLRLKEEADELVVEFGRPILRDWGWASDLIGKKEVTFADIEEHQQRSLLRPSFKWASEDIHGVFSPHGGTLGTNGGSSPGLLTGPSISGLLDPAYWTALALMDATVAVLRYEPTLDRIALMKMVNASANRVGEVFHRLHSQEEATDSSRV